jgi:hypothetical protein
MRHTREHLLASLIILDDHEITEAAFHNVLDSPGFLDETLEVC